MSLMVTRRSIEIKSMCIVRIFDTYSVHLLSKLLELTVISLAFYKNACERTIFRTLTGIDTVISSYHRLGETFSF